MFLFKQKSQDFIVEEILPFELIEKGDAFFVYIEKRNKNTSNIIQHLCSTFKISRKTIGIAWLKDKKAIARQRISIYKRALWQLGWEKAWINAIKEVATVREIHWHTTPLNMSSNISNRFHIRLRAEKNLSTKERATTQQILESILDKWYPNVFWSQRFGINGRNKDQWKEILLWVSKLTKQRHPNRKEIIFKLQAYASYLFNSYFYERNKQELRLVDGDIVTLAQPVDEMSYWIYNIKDSTITLFQNKHSTTPFKSPKRFGKTLSYDPNTMHLTWPVLGFDLLVPDLERSAGKWEKQFFESHWIDAKQMQVFKQRKVFGLRRNLRVQPTKSSVRFQWEDVLLDFTLPAGAYASTLVNEMKKKLEIKEIRRSNTYKRKEHY